MYLCPLPSAWEDPEILTPLGMGDEEKGVSSLCLLNPSHLFCLSAQALECISQP